MVCDDSFDQSAALAVCRSIGKTRAAYLDNISSTGDNKCEIDYQLQKQQASCQFILDDLRCSSSTNSLMQCTRSEIFSHNCGSSEHESMRVLPPVPMVIRQAQEDFIYNQLIRKDITLYIFIMGVNYDSNVSPQPELFNPNRFYKSSETNDERSPYAFTPFSAGPRNYIGQSFALFEEKIVLSTLFRRFSFRTKQTIDDLQLSFEAIMRPAVPIQPTIKHRHHNKNL
ncbi:hypothetical protein I4U23_017011 [Adineta vaga]|nr:hypothetical protein I4U23_017011 [Adineta vaga]